jgi:hypothetical protein
MARLWERTMRCTMGRGSVDASGVIPPGVPAGPSEVGPLFAVGMDSQYWVIALGPPLGQPLRAPAGPAPTPAVKATEIKTAASRRRRIGTQ